MNILNKLSDYTFVEVNLEMSFTTFTIDVQERMSDMKFGEMQHISGCREG